MTLIMAKVQWSWKMSYWCMFYCFHYIYSSLWECLRNAYLHSFIPDFIPEVSLIRLSVYIWQISVSRLQLINYIVIWSNIRVTSKMHKSTHITHILVKKKKMGINNFNKINKTLILWLRGMYKYFFGWMGANSHRLEDLVENLPRGVAAVKAAKGCPTPY